MADPAPAARIGGQPVPLSEAIARAAAILGESRCAVLGGFATDAAGIEAAVALARRIGGVLDHAEAEAALRDLVVMRQEGWIVTTPLQARARADLVLLAGPGIADAWPGFADRLRLAAAPALAPERGRRVIAFGSDPRTAALAGGERIELAAGELASALGVLRALVRGRKLRNADARLVDCAAALAGAAYGVVVWSAASLDELSVVQACGLVEDLNQKTRFAGLPLTAAACAVQVTAALTGFPLRVGFGRFYPEHDAWRFDARRMIESGEADAALWIGCPDWSRGVPLVALAPAGALFAAHPEVEVTVGTPGIDHDAILYDPDLGTLAARRATAPSTTPPASDVLRQIAAALPC